MEWELHAVGTMYVLGITVEGKPGVFSQLKFPKFDFGDSSSEEQKYIFESIDEAELARKKIQNTIGKQIKIFKIETQAVESPGPGLMADE